MRLWTSVFLLCVSSVSSEFDKGEWKDVKIKQGPVRGYRDSSGELWTFRSIPYASVPTDKNKFKAPLPPPTWTEPLDADGDGKNLTDFTEDLLSEEYMNMKKIVRAIWHNFIITGKPVPEGSPLPAWPAVSVGNSPYMSLGQKLELGNAIEPKRFNFWQKIYQKYYREPISPPYPQPEIHTEL
ncbi:unnamed protein product [Arctia plantaginis]|uniref:Carboxylesterase type B domain-containing protein n=1 Tax=Arctia plantaginis TaxID=874455 RepID=A0A8S0YMW4_ARCPL|nr:unnamed protein product [Arctia plantaginis]